MAQQLRSVIVFTVWSLAVAGAWAQSKAPTVPEVTQLNPGRVEPGLVIVSGCIEREAQGSEPAFMLRDMRETPPLQYRLTGDTTLLGLHVGHTAEISGALTTPPERVKPTGLRVKSLTYISATCSKPK